MRQVMLNSMKKYCSRARGAGAVRAFILSIFLSAALTACETVDNTFGNDYIPNDQMMQVARDSSLQIKTYNITADSIYSALNDANYFGSYHDAVVGSVSTSFIGLLRRPFQSSDSTFDKNPVIDSAFIYFNLYGDILGKSEVEQTFEIYELKEQVYRDSAYYSNFDPTPIIESTPLFTFTHSGDGGQIKYEVTDPAFRARLLDTTGYWSDSTFHKRFKGFYIKPVQPHQDAAIYSVSLNNSTMLVYYHNDQTPADTSYYTNYPFSVFYTDSYYGTTYYYDTQAINMIDFDYTNADPALRLDDRSEPVAKTYIQAYGGVQTSLEFTKESIDALKAKVKAAGYRSMVINKAKLEYFYPTRNPDDLDRMLGRLGMYYDYYTGETIPDFNLTYESYNSNYSSYGGFINRSRFLYEMDITMYVQRLLREDADDEDRSVVLGPAVGPLLDNSLLLTQPVPLDGYGSATPPRVVLTYTMIR